MSRLSTLTNRCLALTACLATVAAAASSQAAEPRLWTGGVVAADHPLASQAGLAMLEQGGNAVDAAVAAAFALSVVRPYSCGIGGGGFLLIRLPDDPRTAARGDVVEAAIDHRETAPAAVGPDFFEQLDDAEASRSSGAAVGVPGTVAGLLYALERYGTLDRKTVLAPAIRLAEQGWEADANHVEVAREVAEWFEEHPERKAQAPLLWRTLMQEGRVQVGDRLRNPAQARALRLIARMGAKAFYEGPIAQAIVEQVRAAGGVMTLDDLRSYEVRELEPLVGRFQGRRVLTFPPPSSGGVATLETLGLLERFAGKLGAPLASLDPHSAAYIHALAEACKHAFADRARFLGDGARVDWLLDAGRLDELAGRFDPQRTHKPSAYGSTAPPPDDAGTSHLSVVDQWGGAVACTQTINLSYGSKITVEAFGFALNNEMDDFTTRAGRANAFGLVQSEANLPAPGKRPLSSMSPTIVLQQDPSAGAERVELVAGASGGPRIITGTLQALLNAMVFGMTAQEAVGAPRVHHQWLPNFLQLEPAFDPDAGAPQGEASVGALQGFMTRVQRLAQLRSELEAKGHRLATRATVGVVQLVRCEEAGCEGASDPRKGGAPAGRSR